MPFLLNAPVETTVENGSPVSQRVCGRAIAKVHLVLVKRDLLHLAKKVRNNLSESPVDLATTEVLKGPCWSPTANHFHSNWGRLVRLARPPSFMYSASN